MEVTSSNLVPPTESMNNIQITLPDESVKEIEQGSTSADLARSIGAGLLRASIAAKVDGDVVDLHSPIDSSTNVEILTSKNPEAQEILLHSSAHLLAQAVKELYPQAKIAIGPALEDRFYYDIDVDVTVNEKVLDKLEKKMAELSKENLHVHREEFSRNDALERFKEMGEDYKVEIISEIDENIFILLSLTEPPYKTTGNIFVLKFFLNSFFININIFFSS